MGVLQLCLVVPLLVSLAPVAVLSHGACSKLPASKAYHGSCYFQYFRGRGFVRRTCPEGTRYSQPDCECVTIPSATAGSTSSASAFSPAVSTRSSRSPLSLLPAAADSVFSILFGGRRFGNPGSTQAQNRGGSDRDDDGDRDFGRDSSDEDSSEERDDRDFDDREADWVHSDIIRGRSGKLRHLARAFISPLRTFFRAAASAVAKGPFRKQQNNNIGSSIAKKIYGFLFGRRSSRPGFGNGGGDDDDNDDDDRYGRGDRGGRDSDNDNEKESDDRDYGGSSDEERDNNGGRLFASQRLARTRSYPTYVLNLLKRLNSGGGRSDGENAKSNDGQRYYYRYRNDDKDSYSSNGSSDNDESDNESNDNDETGGYSDFGYTSTYSVKSGITQGQRFHFEDILEKVFDDDDDDDDSDEDDDDDDGDNEVLDNFEYIYSDKFEGVLEYVDDVFDDIFDDDFEDFYEDLFDDDGYDDCFQDKYKHYFDGDDDDLDDKYEDFDNFFENYKNSRNGDNDDDDKDGDRRNDSEEDDGSNFWGGKDEYEVFDDRYLDSSSSKKDDRLFDFGATLKSGSSASASAASKSLEDIFSGFYKDQSSKYN